MTLSLDDILRRGTVVCWAGLWAVVWAVLLGSFGLLWPGKSGKSSLISFLFLFFIYFQFSISFLNSNLNSILLADVFWLF
jgi:hypothetical protein